MCDFRVVLREGEGEKLIMENVSELRADSDGITIKSLFGGQENMPSTVLRSIDFLANTVRLERV